MDYSKPEPLFYSKEQAILKYGLSGNLLKLSSLSEYSRAVDSTGLAIKFVAEGTERYSINKQHYTVAAGSYLLLNGAMEAKVEIESKKNVKGICIHIDNAALIDVLASIMRPDTAYPDPSIATYLTTDFFLENQYQSAHTLLGKKLLALSNEVQGKQFCTDDINTGLFYELAEKLVADQEVVFGQLQLIKTVKTITRRDLCRRLIRGREYIDSNFTASLSTARIAQEANMSEYHFFRLFKTVFGLAPHQYLLHKRLYAAKHMLSLDNSVWDTALACGFADIFSFSKAYKKHFGVPPSTHKQLKLQ